MNNLINVFLEPRDVFTSLDERNNWKDSILPIIITTVVGTALCGRLYKLNLPFTINYN